MNATTTNKTTKTKPCWGWESRALKQKPNATRPKPRSETGRGFFIA